MAQQTAVEWLNNKTLNTNNLEYLIGNIDNWIEQAKQMEKEQIMRAYIDGGVFQFGKDKEAEEYYNKIYMTNKNNNDK